MAQILMPMAITMMTNINLDSVHGSMSHMNNITANIFTNKYRFVGACIIMSPLKHSNMYNNILYHMIHLTPWFYGGSPYMPRIAVKSNLLLHLVQMKPLRNCCEYN